MRLTSEEYAEIRKLARDRAKEQVKKMSRKELEENATAWLIHVLRHELITEKENAATGEGA